MEAFCGKQGAFRWKLGNFTPEKRLFREIRIRSPIRCGYHLL